MAAVFTALVAVACTDSVTSAPLAPPSARFYEDSSAQACTDWNCRSLGTDEYNDLYAGLYQGWLNALYGQDLECYNLFSQGLTKLANNQVYIGRQKPPQAPANATVNGGWNNTGHRRST